jgi:hypothetical protein
MAFNHSNVGSSGAGSSGASEMSRFGESFFSAGLSQDLLLALRKHNNEVELHLQFVADLASCAPVNEALIYWKNSTTANLNQQFVSLYNLITDQLAKSPLAIRDAVDPMNTGDEALDPRQDPEYAALGHQASGAWEFSGGQNWFVPPEDPFAEGIASSTPHASEDGVTSDEEDSAGKLAREEERGSSSLTAAGFYSSSAQVEDGLLFRMGSQGLSEPIEPVPDALGSTAGGQFSAR